MVRIRGCLEKNSTKKKVKCRRCGDFGHFAKTCKEPEMGSDGQPDVALNKRYENKYRKIIFICSLHTGMKINNFELILQEKAS